MKVWKIAHFVSVPFIHAKIKRKVNMLKQKLEESGTAVNAIGFIKKNLLIKYLN